MRPSPALRIMLAASIAALAACSGGSSVIGGSPGGSSVGGSSVAGMPLTPQAVVQRVVPSCTVKVWASDLGGAVYGFTGPNSAPCITLAGTYNGSPFNAPFGLATDLKQNLYVADLNNDRIVVFRANGAFVKVLNTNLNGQNYQPVGVCVSKTGVVGVGNREYNNSGPAGNVEFFPSTAGNNSTATGWASTVLESPGYCAFDEKGNFFVDGTATSGGQKIAYVARNHVNHPNQTLKDSLQGTASYWIGMYSRIDSPADDTLSVGQAVGSSSTETVATFAITGPPNGPLAFGPPATYTLSNYPVTSDPLYQLAPTKGGAAGKLLIADYGDSEVLYTGAGGGAVVNFNPVTATVGVATAPTGQY